MVINNTFKTLQTRDKVILKNLIAFQASTGPIPNKKQLMILKMEKKLIGINQTKLGYDQVENQEHEEEREVRNLILR
jgi:hypothetical protein